MRDVKREMLILSERWFEIVGGTARMDSEGKIKFNDNISVSSFLYISPELISKVKTYRIVVVDANIRKINAFLFFNYVVPNLGPKTVPRPEQACGFCDDIEKGGQAFIFIDAPTYWRGIDVTSVVNKREQGEWIPSPRHLSPRTKVTNRGVVKGLFPFLIRREIRLSPLVTAKIDWETNRVISLSFVGPEEMREPIQWYFDRGVNIYSYGQPEEYPHYKEVYVAWFFWASPRCVCLPQCDQILREILYNQHVLGESIEKLHSIVAGERSNIKRLKKRHWIKGKPHGLPSSVDLISGKVYLCYQILQYLPRRKKFTYYPPQREGQKGKYERELQYCGEKEYRILKVLQEREGETLTYHEIAQDLQGKYPEKHKQLPKRSYLQEHIRNIENAVRLSFPGRNPESIFKRSKKGKKQAFCLFPPPTSK